VIVAVFAGERSSLQGHVHSTTFVDELIDTSLKWACGHGCAYANGADTIAGDLRTMVAAEFAGAGAAISLDGLGRGVFAFGTSRCRIS
jgi:hypothetical protein